MLAFIYVMCINNSFLALLSSIPLHVYTTICLYIHLLINIWVVNINKTLLHNPWVKVEMTMEIRKYFELNKNEPTMK